MTGLCVRVVCLREESTAYQDKCADRRIMNGDTGVYERTL
jgi:hypothetical protein